MRLSRKDIFLAKLFLASSVLHGIIFFCCFFLARGDRFTQRIDFSMLQHQQVVFLPFQKSVRASAKGSGAAHDEQTALTPQVTQQSVTGKTTIAKSSARKGKKGQGSKREQQAQKAKEAARNEKKKQIADKLAEKQRKKDEDQLLKAELANGAVGSPSAGDPIALATSEPIYLGQNDLDNLEIAQSIREEVANVWRPPAGLGVGRQCKVKVVVDWDGAIKELTFEEPSHVAAFDVSVRLAVQQMKFPKAVFGKELILPFAA